MFSLLKAIRSKWNFTKPQKKEILVYDSVSMDVAELLFNKDNYEVLNVRNEDVNIFILFKTIFKTGIKNIKDNYKLNFIKQVSPKVIFSVFTYNPSFFRLKNLYPNALYISLSISCCDRRFFSACEKYYENNLNPKLKSDYLFVVGDYYKDLFIKYIDTKIVNIGSIINNYHYLKNYSFQKKLDSILFISQVYSLPDNEIYPKYKAKINNEKKIIHALEKYCKKNSLRLKIATRNNKNAIEFYKFFFGNGDWKVYPRIDLNTSYDLVNESSLIIFTNSFLGLEALSKGKRCVAFPPEEFPIEEFVKKYSDHGPFWSRTFNYEILEQYIKNILDHSDEKWKELVRENIGDIIKYDPKNTILKGTLKSLKIENILN